MNNFVVPRGRWGTSRRVALAACAAVALTVAPASTAWAAGSIASAQTVTFGQQEFGNTANGEWDCGPADFWNLSLVSGDHVMIDWETSNSDYAHDLHVFPAGTTDFSINNVQALQVFYVGSNNKAESTFAAGTTGIYPLIFAANGCDSTNAGPFDFTAYVAHALSVSLPPLPAASSGTVAVGVHNPDGVPLSGPPIVVNLQVSATGVPWTTIGSASPLSGTATIAYTAPSSLAGRKVKF